MIQLLKQPDENGFVEKSEVAIMQTVNAETMVKEILIYSWIGRCFSKVKIL